MMRPGQDIPTTEQELERKTAQALEKWATGLASGEYSFQRTHDAMDVLWDCVSGLVSRDLMETISEVQNYCIREMKRGKQWAVE
jgi:hypothetical protein